MNPITHTLLNSMYTKSYAEYKYDLAHVLKNFNDERLREFLLALHPWSVLDTMGLMLVWRVITPDPETQWALDAMAQALEARISEDPFEAYWQGAHDALRG